MNPTTFAEHKRCLVEQLQTRRQLALDIQAAHGVDTSAIVRKVDEHVTALASRRFTVVLFGAFSDGKTTVVGALTQRLGLPIGRGPTTDRLTTYDYGDVVLVDVPGLFSEEERHDAITRAYVSEANLLLFVLDAVNPLKPSHHVAVRWLLKELGKATSSIFVVNKMDDVADLDDPDDFGAMAGTKSSVVRTELTRIGIDNAGALSVVCVAADPDGKGLEYWRAHPDDYERLSRLNVLRTAVDECIRRERVDLEVAAGVAGVRESTRLIADALSELRVTLERENELVAEQARELRKRLDTLARGVARVQRLIREDKLALHQEIMQLLDSAADARALANVVSSRIGPGGELLAEELALLVQKHTEEVAAAQSAFAEELERSADFFTEHLSKVAKAFAKAGGNVGKIPARQIADALIKGRDVLRLPIKFKPWQALKWGKWLKGGGEFVAALGPILDTAETLMKVVGHVLLDKRRASAKDAIAELFKQFDKTLDPESFEQEYFPAVGDARKVLAAAEADLLSSRERIEQLEAHERALRT